MSNVIDARAVFGSRKAFQTIKNISEKPSYLTLVDLWAMGITSGQSINPYDTGCFDHWTPME